MSRRSVALAVAAVVAALAAVGAWQGPRLLASDDGHVQAARAFAEAWTGGALPALAYDAASTADPAAVATATADLTPEPDDRPAQVVVGGVSRDGDDAKAQLSVRWELGASWTYATFLPLHRSDGTWRPVLTPAVVHPALAGGGALRARSVQAPRAPITDRTGAPLVADRPVVTVGIQPGRATDLAATVRRAAALTGVDPAPLLTRVQAAAPDAFVEVVTLRREAYDAVRDRLRPLPGVVLREGVRPLAPTAAFARALLGTVGPATADAVQASGGRVRPDEVVGLSGLQRRFEPELGGRPGLVVEVVPPAGAPAQVLQETPPVAGQPVQVTLDPAVQEAADAALATAPDGKAAALVALQASTGEVLAVANNGPDGPGADRALTGRYPPGSTFKIASTLALLRAGLAPGDPVPCPPTVSVSGKTFRNAEAEALGTVPFRTDFADSCNTAFVGSAERVTPTALATAARDLGYGEDDLGVGASPAQVPVTDDPVLHAAQMIGQGQVLASPLQVAASAAAVAAGRLHSPRLLVARAAPDDGPDLPQAGALRDLTRLVVTSGTGTALRTVPGAPVGGKTGTAEYGTQVPPRTHAWFAGYQGDLAFAVLVEDGGFGGQVAAPLAAAFLRGLPGA